jgi:hypothetical protein
MRKLRIESRGIQYGTRLLDAETGEDIGKQLGLSAVHWSVGGSAGALARVTLELAGPVEIVVQPNPLLSK